MIYLAQPYSHPVADVVEMRVLWGMGAAAALAQMGWHPYAPIAHWHETATKFNLPTDNEAWEAHDFHMLEKCDQFGILTLCGWNQSKGLLREWVKAEELKKPPYFIQIVSWQVDTNNDLHVPIIHMTKTTYRYIEEVFYRGQDSQQRGLDTGEAGNINLG